MLNLIIIALLILCVCVIAWSFWQLRKTLVHVVDLMEKSHQRQPGIYKSLSRQVGELQQSMGGLVNGLKAVGHQVYNLNLLAGHALQEAQQQAHWQQEEAPQMPQLIQIEMRDARENDGDPSDGAPRILTPEDMPPEVLERFLVFQAVYRALLANKHFPSQHRPDLN